MMRYLDGSGDTASAAEVQENDNNPDWVPQ